MTTQSDCPVSSTKSLPAFTGVEPPKIQSEEDVPFDSCGNSPEEASQDKLSKTDSLDDQITKFKYITGREVLYISMGSMGATVFVSIILSLFGKENPIVENAFEVFKLIAMTVLGYLFGSNSKSNS